MRGLLEDLLCAVCLSPVLALVACAYFALGG